MTFIISFLIRIFGERRESPERLPRQAQVTCCSLRWGSERVWGDAVAGRRLHLIPLIPLKTHPWGCPPVSGRHCCTASLQAPCNRVVPGQTAPPGEVQCPPLRRRRRYWWTQQGGALKLHHKEPPAGRKPTEPMPQPCKELARAALLQPHPLGRTRNYSRDGRKRAEGNHFPEKCILEVWRAEQGLCPPAPEQPAEERTLLHMKREWLLL